MSYLTEPVPAYGSATLVGAGIRRIVAPNPSLMTYHGTNTYLIEDRDGVIVIDPGPNVQSHIDAILAATAGKVGKILLTHTHFDHLEACMPLKEATGARTFAFERSACETFTPDVPLADGDVIAGMQALHTPGHASDHICYARTDGILFSGDHVMSWSSTVVSPPLGDMDAYCANLRRLLAREDTMYLPGHGPPLPEPQSYVRNLLNHREERERAILDMLRAGTRDPAQLAEVLYANRDIRLRRAAERNVISHLLKLKKEGLVRQKDEEWQAI